MTPIEVPGDPLPPATSAIVVSGVQKMATAGATPTGRAARRLRTGGAIVVKGARFELDSILELRAFGEVEAEPERAPYLEGVPQLSDELLSLTLRYTLTRADEARLLGEIDRIAQLIREARERWEAQQAAEAESR